MAGEIICHDCGAIASFKDPDSKVVCPECGFLLRYGEEAEAPNRVVTAAKTRTRKRKKTRRRTEERPVRRPPSEQETSVFVAGDDDGVRVSDEAVESDWFDNSPRWWFAWIDPVALLWLPILVPIFTLTSVAFVVGYALHGIQTAGGFTGLGIPIIIFGMVLFSIPAGYFCRHLAEIMRTWAIGDQRDPSWNEFDVVEAFANFWWWCACAASTAAVILPITWFLSMSPAGVRLLEQRWVWAVLFLAASIYFSVALLAVIMLHTVVACNPVTVLSAIFRLLVPLMSYAFELLVHVGLAAGIAFAASSVWEISFLLVIPLVLLEWAFVILSASRLMRRMGIIYAAHADLLGWFRTPEERLAAKIDPALET